MQLSHLKYTKGIPCTPRNCMKKVYREFTFHAAVKILPETLVFSRIIVFLCKRCFVQNSKLKNAGKVKKTVHFSVLRHAGRLFEKKMFLHLQILVCFTLSCNSVYSGCAGTFYRLSE